MMKMKMLLLFLLLAPRCEDPGPNAPIPAIKLEKVAQGFRKPVELIPFPGQPDEVLVAEQIGVVRRLSLKTGQHQPFLDLTDRVINDGELGLLGLATPPWEKTFQSLFVNYTAPKGRRWETRISRISRRKNAKSFQEDILLRFSQPFPNHNGGKIAFGPDGYLYIATGDGGAANDPLNAGQRLDTLLGKILRIDVRTQPYGIPPDNPFRDNPNARPEIFAYGLRNPWKFSFDRETGLLIAADVGQNQREEIDIIKPGKNYGWRIMEGNICTPAISTDCSPPPNHEPPILDYPRSDGISVIGGFVYRGPESSLCGVYIFGDYGSGRIWGIRIHNGKASKKKVLLNTDLRISSFGEDAEGNLYVLAHERGEIYRLRTGSP